MRGVFCAAFLAGAVGVSAADPALALSGWSVQSTPNPAGTTRSYLTGVSCTAATATVCTAAGYSLGSPPYAPLADRWMSSTNAWSIQTTPITAVGASLSGVSCTAATSCTAVGQSANQTLAERWNGTIWAIQPTPNPAGSTSSVLSGVSCKGTSCIAVGNYVNPSKVQLTLAEHWNASSNTWSIQTTPNPRGATSSLLSGVSCTSATACTAVGNYVNGAGSQGTLAERYSG